METMQTSEVSNQFKAHLSNANNQRIIFSGSFGSGKTTFLHDFLRLKSSLRQVGSSYEMNDISKLISEMLIKARRLNKKEEEEGTETVLLIDDLIGLSQCNRSVY